MSSPTHDAPEGARILEGLKKYVKDHKDSLDKSLVAILTDKNTQIKCFTEGQSNPTYKIDVPSSKSSFVLRKKPDGHLLRGAHQVEREFKTFSALHKTGFPVAKPLLLCDNSNYLSTPFYVAEFVEGRVFRDMSLPELSPSERTACYKDMCRVLAQLHAVEPSKVGLADLSNSKTPFLKRNVKTWYNQFKNSPTKDSTKELEDSMDAIYEWLNRNIPEKSINHKIVHGDYKLDNVIFHPTEPRIIAVLDWEIVSLGDPLCDFFYCFQSMEKSKAGTSAPLVGAPFGADGELMDGIPPSNVLKWWYTNYAKEYNVGIPKSDDLERTNFLVYKIYSTFRIACITRGVQARFEGGNAASPNASRFTSKLIEVMALHCIYTIMEAEETYRIPVVDRFFSHENHRKLIVTNPAMDPVLAKYVQAPPMSEHAATLFKKLLRFMDEHIYPNEELFEEQLNKDRWQIPPIMKELEQKAKAQGLWNLFLPEWSGITNAEYARFAEIMGRNLWAAEVFNCQFPDTGNMETLHLFANEKQKKQWLDPLKEGIIKSAFVMTEPQVSSADAVSISTEIRKTSDGKHYIINGNKWWISSGGDPRLKILLLLGNTSMNNTSGKELARHKKHSVVLIPADAPGIKFIEPMTAFGFDDAPQGHFRVSFTDVKVPVENLLWEEGTGFAIAQARLGPGRLHHCMRTVGLADRALELFVDRVLTRKASQPLHEKGTIRKDIADARMDIEMMRNLVVNASHKIDVYGSKEARKEIAMAKVMVPNMAQKILDKVMQAHGAVGLSHQFPLSRWYARIRTVRFMDGPDEVHRETIAKLEIREYQAKHASKL